MKTIEKKQISRAVTGFHGRAIPEPEAFLVGYAALIEAYHLHVPLPEQLALISRKHHRYDKDGWAVYTPRHMPKDTLSGHLAFALRYEGVDFAVLHALFQRVGGNEISAWVRKEPLGRYSRRTWFFYEWLTGKKLSVSDATTGNFIDALDPKHYYVEAGIPSRRHRVRDNLPGVQGYCPLVRRTEKIENYLAGDWKAHAHEETRRVHPDVLARAAAFLLLQDSRASFAIEGENPGKSRAERWGKAIGQAGLRPLTIEELLRLQRIVIPDARFVKMGLRKEGGFIGVHDRASQTPLPDHISARWQDVARLVQGLIDADTRQRDGILDPVIAAASISFGFVFIHPFADGNGRLHRYLIHHVLTERGFAPKGIVFPVSAVILKRLDEYRQVLESYSRPRLDFIEWKPTLDGNVEVLNETIDLYRYFDATRQVEFLIDCVVETIEHSLPEEIRFLERYDQMKTAINDRFDMPDHKADLLIRFLQQNNGVFSKRATQKEFKSLSDKERRELESAYRRIFVSSKPDQTRKPSKK